MSEPSTYRAARRLVTIVACDFEGFSRNMGRDEERTARILKAHRAVVDSIIDLHGGRIFNTAGDSVLAEFGSPVEAVRCATEIQDALGTRNKSLSHHDRLTLRIGVNLGDVMVQGEDLLGDAVNVAARLESVAEPGGISISGSVYEQVQGKLDLSFRPLGAQSLKNIDRPIRVYHLERGVIEPATTPTAPDFVTSGRRLGRPAAIASGVLVLVLAAAALGVALWQSRQPEAPRVSTSVMPASPSGAHWLNGRWVGIVGRPPTTDMFCVDLDDRCRVFSVGGVTGDGSYEGALGFPNRMGIASVDVRGDVVQIKTGAPTFVEVTAAGDGTMSGTLKDRFGASYPIRMRRVR